jgi:hypothetical protein
MNSWVPPGAGAAPVSGGPGRGPRTPLAGLAQQTARCSVPGCSRPIDPTRLMCRFHWYAVPKEIRDRVWATWRSGQGALSPEHGQAVRDAIAACQKARTALQADRLGPDDPARMPG